MSKHHYVVEYDTDKKRWDWSPEVEHRVFDHATIESKEHGWVHDEGEWHGLKKIDEQVGEKLSLGLRFMNWCENETSRG
jgi:hypothetical protein